MASIMNFLGYIPKRKIRKHLYECYGHFTYEELTNFGIMKRHLSPESQKEIEFNEKTIKLLEDILFIKEKMKKNKSKEDIIKHIESLISASRQKDIEYIILDIKEAYAILTNLK